MGTLVRWIGFGVLGLVLVVAGVYAWATLATNRAMARSFEVHTTDFPIPFPLSDEERAELAIADEAEAARVALERARERGRHLIESRYACADCHGEDFGGGVMVDAFPLGSLLGPNLTSGEGGIVADYTTADWDRIVRHGVRPDGRPAVMPSQDFLRMSDRELSDIVSYISSLEPVDNPVPPSTFGPLGRVLVATGQIQWSADLVANHTGTHPAVPPPAEPSVAFGEHLAGTCAGCHGMDLTGGPIKGGDPAWGPASNLTPHPDGLAGWSFEDFRRAMVEGVRPDGSELAEPMTMVTPMAQRMEPVELEALWSYLSSLEPKETSGG